MHHTAYLTHNFLSSTSKESFVAGMNQCKSAAVRDEAKYDIGILRGQSEMLSLRSQG